MVPLGTCTSPNPTTSPLRLRGLIKLRSHLSIHLSIPCLPWGSPNLSCQPRSGASHLWGSPTPAFPSCSFSLLSSSQAWAWAPRDGKWHSRLGLCAPLSGGSRGGSKCRGIQHQEDGSPSLAWKMGRGVTWPGTSSSLQELRAALADRRQGKGHLSTLTERDRPGHLDQAWRRILPQPPVRVH